MTWHPLYIHIDPSFVKLGSREQSNKKLIGIGIIMTCGKLMDVSLDARILMPGRLLRSARRSILPESVRVGSCLWVAPHLRLLQQRFEGPGFGRDACSKMRLGCGGRSVPVSISFLMQNLRYFHVHSLYK